MGPEKALPHDASFSSPEEYATSLLNFLTTSTFLRTLCGGVHVLEFFTFKPGLYKQILPLTWRDFFASHDIMDILDLLMREDLESIIQESWREGPAPPADLLDYIRSVRRHSLNHKFDGSSPPALTREVALGMGVKKLQEVSQFTAYISRLTSDLAASDPENAITHIIDLGSGQGYLPRALASPPHNHTVVGVESREHNVAGSQNWDILAKLAPKPLVMRNKKEWKEEQARRRAAGTDAPAKLDPSDRRTKKGERGFFHHPGLPDLSIPADQEAVHVSCTPSSAGSVQYVSHYLLDGDLTRITCQILSATSLETIRHNAHLSAAERVSLPRALFPSVRALVMGLHACGNLTHHGLRSLVLTAQVRAVAMVGCCYNLLAERLGPPTTKLPAPPPTPALRSRNTRLEAQQAARDPHGFPMSRRFCEVRDVDGQRGIRLNITARMMAVQAPRNWGRGDSAAFFTRHFYRALLQVVFVDLGLIPAPTGRGGGTGDEQQHDADADGDGGGKSDDPDTVVPSSDPVVLGSLPKRAYFDFLTYVRAAAAKLGRHETHPTFPAERARRFADGLDGLSDERVRAYEERFARGKKELSVVWSLMAFSAGVVEAAIVVDRWSWLREQGESEPVSGWVEPVFGYEYSPRNMVVVGVKRMADRGGE